MTTTTAKIDTSATTVPTALSIDEFCERNRISRALFYILRKEGGAPRVMKVRGRTLISVAAEHDWQRQMEATA